MRFAKSLIVLATATLAFAQDAVVSRGLFLGFDTTSPGARGAEIFRAPRNHATAAASILSHAASQTKYAPQSQSPTKVLDPYNQFKAKVDEFPGFDNGKKFHVPLWLEGGFANLQKEIEANYLYDDKASIARQIRYAVPVVNKNENLQEWEISLVVIRQPKNRPPEAAVIVELISVALQLETGENGEVQIPRQYTTLVTRRYPVNERYLEEHADVLAKNIKLTKISQFGLYFRSRDVAFSNIREWYDAGKRLADEDYLGC
ncbi:hypothetical protein BGZ73_002578 [Actinomortierella ambigua]|nr:hypothetical protein BGZ73_002578 [Actinomortierella ambigua]